jgi:hypothetical protein
MAAVFDSNQSIFMEQYGRSRQSFPAGSGDFGNNGDRSRNSVNNEQLSPAMEFAFSDSALSEPDMEWMTLMVDNDSTSPMSHTLSESDLFSTSWPNTEAMAQGFDIPAAQRGASLGAFQVHSYQHTSRAPNQGKTLSRSFFGPCFNLVQQIAPRLRHLPLETFLHRAGPTRNRTRILQRFGWKTCQKKSQPLLRLFRRRRPWNHGPRKDNVSNLLELTMFCMD